MIGNPFVCVYTNCVSNEAFQTKGMSAVAVLNVVLYNEIDWTSECCVGIATSKFNSNVFKKIKTLFN